METPLLGNSFWVNLVLDLQESCKSRDTDRGIWECKD